MRHLRVSEHGGERVEVGKGKRTPREPGCLNEGDAQGGLTPVEATATIS
jgi:hypothetical protein